MSAGVDYAAHREGDLPANRRPVSIWLIAALAVLGYCGLIYFDTYGGGFSPRIYVPGVEPGDFIPPGPPHPPEHKVFQFACAPCHQANGLGSSATGCPPLDGSEWVTAPNPDRIIRIVLNGATGLITVNGKQYGLAGQIMIPFKDSLTDEQIAAVLTYVRQAWSNNRKLTDPTVTPDQIQAVRAQIRDRNRNWTAVELLQIPDRD